jgi:phosphoglycolate phosphatase/putative hydrolase of the HAD superfamily
MKIYKIPRQVQAILFDMDSTLYSHPLYAQTQIDLPVAKLAGLRGKSFEEMREDIKRYREDWAASHEGQSVSLGNVFTAFGISIEESIRWRETLYEPEKYLAPDEKLRSSLSVLGASRVLAVLTNNPVAIAQRTLAALGVEDLFQVIVGLDTCGVSKPHKAPFIKALELCGTAAADCLSVGDRYDIDIRLPLELGMGGILVDGAEDVYKLPEILK